MEAASELNRETRQITAIGFHGIQFAIQRSGNNLILPVAIDIGNHGAEDKGASGGIIVYTFALRGHGIQIAAAAAKDEIISAQIVDLPHGSAAIDILLVRMREEGKFLAVGTHIMNTAIDISVHNVQSVVAIKIRHNG